MSDPLLQAGWYAPQRVGPRARTVLPVLVLAIIAMFIWHSQANDQVAASSARSTCDTHQIQVANDGAVTTTTSGARARTPEYAKRVGRFHRVTPLTAPADPHKSRCIRTLVELEAGVEPSRVAIRAFGEADRVRSTPSKIDDSPELQIDLRGPASNIEYLVSVTVPTVPKGTEPQQITDLTKQFDARRAVSVRKFDSIDRQLTRSLPLFGAVGVILMLTILGWHRHSRAFRSMRRPGPGTETPIGPPSSIDPVGAAILVAGALPPDLVSAFAGRVLDLVERKQLRLRRASDPVTGAGVVLGLHPVDDDDPVSGRDTAVELLRAIADPHDLSVVLPDSGTPRVSIDRRAWRAWDAHVRARARFERIIEGAALRRLDRAIIATGSALVVVPAIAHVRWGASTWTLPMLVMVSVAPILVTLLSWRWDAQGWVRVHRGRRLERAQWLAWRNVVRLLPIAQVDARTMPTLVAVNAADSALPAVAPKDSVGLEAVTAGTVLSLRALASVADLAET